MLITLFLWRLAPRWGRVLLAAYPLAMTFALVYTAEHYVSDILLGWIYALIAFWTVTRVAELLAARSESRAVSRARMIALWRSSRAVRD